MTNIDIESEVLNLSKKNQGKPQDFKNDFEELLVASCEVLTKSNPELTVVTVWNPILPDGRAMVFLSSDNDEYKKLAKLNLAIFGRGTTLNERLLWFSKKSKDKLAKIEIKIIDDIDKKDALDFSKKSNNIVISIWNQLWEEIKANNLNDYEKHRQDMLKKIDNGFVDEFAIARALKTEFAGKLREQRLKVFVDRCPNFFSTEDSKKNFFKVLWHLTSKDDIEFYRKLNQYSCALKPDSLSLSLDFEVIDQFFAFLQALAHFYPKAKKFVGISKGYTPVVGSSINYRAHA